MKWRDQGGLLFSHFSYEKIYILCCNKECQISIVSGWKKSTLSDLKLYETLSSSIQDHKDHFLSFSYQNIGIVQQSNSSDYPKDMRLCKNINYQKYHWQNQGSIAFSGPLYKTPEEALFSFKQKILILSLFLNETICCGYSLEVPWWGASNEYPQHTFSWRNKENTTWLPPFIWR